MKIKLSELITKFGGKLVGDDIEISGIAPTDLAGPSQITFITDAKYKKDLSECKASAIIIAENNAEGVDFNKIIWR